METATAAPEEITPAKKGEHQQGHIKFLHYILAGTIRFSITFIQFKMQQPMKKLCNIFVWMAALLMIFSTLSGCQESKANEKYPYSWKDFDGKVSELLYKIEQHGIVFLPFSGCRESGEIYDSAKVYFYMLETTADRKELVKATKCSSPAIRATALAILGSDTTFNIEKILTEHIFDSSHIFDDYEHRKWTVFSFAMHNSDYYLTEKVKSRLNTEVLKKNPFELAAYLWLYENPTIDTFPGFYSIIKKMALFPDIQISSDIINWNMGIIALEKLASYQYEADIPLIDSLMEGLPYYSNGSFLAGNIIRKFKAPAFEKHYLDTGRRWLLQFNFLEYTNYLRYPYLPQEGITDFVSLLLEHKSSRSARLLELIWDRSPLERYVTLPKYQFDQLSKDIKIQIAAGVREHKSPHYKSLIAKTAAFSALDNSRTKIIKD